MTIDNSIYAFGTRSVPKTAAIIYILDQYKILKMALEGSTLTGLGITPKAEIANTPRENAALQIGRVPSW